MTTRSRGESGFVTANGLRLHYVDWGNPDAPHVVAVHGNGVNSGTFNGFARHFRDRFHIVAPDVRGHGDSEWSPDGIYGHDRYVSDLEGMVDELGLERFTLIGSSMGSTVSLHYIGKHPDRVERLVIVDLGLDPEPNPGAQQMGAAIGASPDFFPTLDEAAAYRRTMQPSLARLSVEEQRSRAVQMFRQRPDGAWSWKSDPRLHRRQPGEARPQAVPPPRPNLWPVLEAVACPVLIVWGMDSTRLREPQANKMTATPRDGRLVAVPDVGHPPLLSEPASIAALEDFLAGKPTPVVAREG